MITDGLLLRSSHLLPPIAIGAYDTLSVIDDIERLNCHNYELVILDISLSETDGLQLFRFMRQMTNMPILVLCHSISVSRLRQKLDGGECIENVRGMGYRYIDPKRKKE